MKSILYAGLTFMVAAGIYGFADFKTDKTQSAFNSLYTGPSKAPSTPIVSEFASVPFDESGEPVFTEEPGPKREKKYGKEDINYKLFSRSSLREEQEEIVPLREVKAEKKK